MAIFKCKMCLGELDFNVGDTIVTCRYCDSKQTLPRILDDRCSNLYDRANHYRCAGEYDRARALYEEIIKDDVTAAEAYWGIVLSRFGIDYVEDPKTKRRIPTVNRAQFTSILADADYLAALENANLAERAVYEEEAHAIDEIQKGILAISRNEEPFDVFICYKETDQNGRRTPDSVLAQELYYGLVNEGFKVFFSRITLEDKLGSAYEPYIFSALNSAPVMVVLGTRAEHFNAVWVKNEWSRYLTLIKEGAKKTLIPAYRDMDPYDLPDDFSHLQAQDMSKLGFMQDLIRGIEKIIGVQNPNSETGKKPGTSNSEESKTAPLLKRMTMFLEDGEWVNADQYCEKILDIEPECSKAYIGKLMAKSHISTVQEIYKADFSSAEISKFYNKACKFSSPDEYDLYRAQYAIYEERKNEEKRRTEEEQLKQSKVYIGITQVSKATIQKIESMLGSGQKNEAIRYVSNAANLNSIDAEIWVENHKFYDLSNPQFQFEGSSAHKMQSSYKTTYNPSPNYPHYAYEHRNAYEAIRTQPKQTNYTDNDSGVEYCNKWVTFFLCVFYLGLFGVHRFYEGDKKWGKIYLFTLGLFGYGWYFDILRILFKPTRYPKKRN